MAPGLGSGAVGSVMPSCDALRASLAIVRAGLSGAGGRFCAAGAFGPAALRLYPSLFLYNLLRPLAGCARFSVWVTRF